MTKVQREAREKVAKRFAVALMNVGIRAQREVNVVAFPVAFEKTKLLVYVEVKRGARQSPFRRRKMRRLAEAFAALKITEDDQ